MLLNAKRDAQLACKRIASLVDLALLVLGVLNQKTNGSTTE